MSPPHERSRPRGKGPANTSLDNDAALTVPQGTDVVQELARLDRRNRRRACRHAHTFRPCRGCQRARADAQRELGNASHRCEPSTYGLDAHELRRHANALVESGWTLDEVTSVLAVERRAS